MTALRCHNGGEPSLMLSSIFLVMSTHYKHWIVSPEEKIFGPYQNFEAANQALPKFPVGSYIMNDWEIRQEDYARDARLSNFKTVGQRVLHYDDPADRRLLEDCDPAE